MKKIAKFEKVSFEQFKKDVEKCFGNTVYKFQTEEGIRKVYDSIELPKRATKGSAGYDFKCPFNLLLHKGQPVIIPTGIRVKIDDGWVLKLYPRSGLGFKYGLGLLNTVGIIDSDYYNSDNEGHIIMKISHVDGEYMLPIKQGDGFSQGVFLEYGITVDDMTNGTRNGGFGSTDCTNQQEL